MSSATTSKTRLDTNNNQVDTRGMYRDSPPPTFMVPDPSLRAHIRAIAILAEKPLVGNTSDPELFFWLRFCFVLNVHLCVPVIVTACSMIFECLFVFVGFHDVFPLFCSCDCRGFLAVVVKRNCRAGVVRQQQRHSQSVAMTDVEPSRGEGSSNDS